MEDFECMSCFSEFEMLTNKDVLGLIRDSTGSSEYHAAILL